MVDLLYLLWYVVYEKQKERMYMVNLKAKPYCLSDEDIAWVKNTIAGMTDEEKVASCFGS